MRQKATRGLYGKSTLQRMDNYYYIIINMLMKLLISVVLK